MNSRRTSTRAHARAVSLLVGLAAMLSFTAGCRATATPPEEDRSLVVASDLANPPFAFVDADGAAQGRDVEMMQMIAHVLDRELVWRRMPFDELLTAVQRGYDGEGRIDAVCATLGVTPERRKRMAFTRPYFETAIAVVVRTGEGEPEKLADLAGRPVGAGGGTTSERAVRRGLPQAIGIFESKDASTRERLLSGELDGAVMDGPAADALVASSGGRLRRLPRDLDLERYAVALPLFQERLTAQIDRALAELEKRGLLRQLDRKHGLR